MCHTLCVQLLDEVRVVGPQRMGTSLAGNMVAELVVLLRDFPTGKYDLIQLPRLWVPYL